MSGQRLSGFLGIIMVDTYNDEVLLEFQNISVGFDTPQGEVQAVRDVSLSLKKGEILCVVGESGCGKTVLCKSAMKLLPKNAHIKSGKVLVCGEDITGYKEKQMRKLRGTYFSSVFQDPMTTLNPTIPIGKQITEAIKKHEKISSDEARERAVEMLDMVGISDARKRFGLQPHFFSGGMRQRCVLAVALATNPKILFADEATTALDVTVEEKILNLLLDIRDKTGIGIIFISHDLGAVARIADRVAVMYAGKVVENYSFGEAFADARAEVGPGGVFVWHGGVYSTYTAEEWGSMTLAERNEFALAIDYEEMPPMFDISETHKAATWLLDKRAPKVVRPELYGRRSYDG